MRDLERWAHAQLFIHSQAAYLTWKQVIAKVTCLLMLVYYRASVSGKGYSAVLLFSEWNKIFFGYFHPPIIFLDNENKCFSGWPNRYFWKKLTGTVVVEPHGDIVNFNAKLCQSVCCAQMYSSVLTRSTELYNWNNDIKYTFRNAESKLS